MWIVMKLFDLGQANKIPYRSIFTQTSPQNNYCLAPSSAASSCSVVSFEVDSMNDETDHPSQNEKVRVKVMKKKLPKKSFPKSYLERFRQVTNDDRCQDKQCRIQCESGDARSTHENIIEAKEHFFKGSASESEEFHIEAVLVSLL